MIDHRSTVTYTAQAAVELKAEKRLGFNLTGLHIFAHYTRTEHKYINNNISYSVIISSISIIRGFSVTQLHF